MNFGSVNIGGINMAKVKIESLTFGDLDLGAYFAYDGVVYYKITRCTGVCIAKVSDGIATEITGKYSFDDNMKVKLIRHINFR